MASCIALAEFPGRVEDVFLNRGKSEAGVYGLQFWALNVPVTILVDDVLPLNKNSPSNTLYAKLGEDGSVWGAVMEKAFAKFHGTYARIAGGDSADGISTLNGSPYDHQRHDNQTNRDRCDRYYSGSSNTRCKEELINEQQVWALIEAHDPRRGLLTSGTPCTNGGDDTVND